MKFAETPYFLLKEYLDDDYQSVSYQPFPNTDYNKSLAWNNILFYSRGFNVYDNSNGLTVDGEIDTLDYWKDSQITSTTSGGVYFFDRRDVHDRGRINFNSTSYTAEGDVWAESSSGDCILVGLTRGIVVKGGGLYELFVKNGPEDEELSDKQKGYTPLNFSYIDFQDENMMRVSVHNATLQQPSTVFSIVEGSNVSGGYFLDYDTDAYDKVGAGREVYFRKDSMFHEWLEKFAHNIIKEKFGLLFDIRGYVNTDKMFIYIGKIYAASANDLGVNYIIEYYGLKDYIFNIVPQHQKTPNLKEFVNVAFDRLYHNIYTRQKDRYTLNDPMEVDIRYLGLLSKYYGMIDLQPVVVSETVYREFVKNLIHLLKRKGTFSGLYTLWSTVQTNNRLNIYERWIPKDNPSIADTSRVVLEDEWVDILYISKPEYGVVVPTDGAGVGWYSDYDVIDINSLNVCSNTSSINLFPTYPTDRYSIDDMILSSNYRVELDINNSPISNTSVFSKDVFDGLYETFELTKPVYRTSRYSIIFAPIVDLTGNVVSLYGDTDRHGQNYDNIYVNSTSFIQDYSHVDSYIGYQCVYSTSWSFHLEFDTPNLIVSCYDLDFNLITPLTTTITSAGDNIYLTFDTPQTGYIVTKKTNKSPIIVPVNGNQIINVEHGLDRSDLVIQVYYNDPITNSKMLVDIDNITIFDNDNIIVDIGVGNIGLDNIIVHICTSTEHTVIPFVTSGIDNSCIIDHDFYSKLVILSVYDDSNINLNPDVSLINITSTKLTFDDPQTGYAVVLNIGSYDVFQTLIGFNEEGIQTSPIYNILDGDQNILETGLIEEFKQDNEYNYMNWELEYLTEYDDIATIEILSRDTVQFRTVISDLYKPPAVDFKIHYRIVKTTIGYEISWYDTDGTLPTNQYLVESTLSIVTNVHPSILTWEIITDSDLIYFSDTGNKIHTGYHIDTDMYYIDPTNSNNYIITLDISSTMPAGEIVTINVNSGIGVTSSIELLTVLEGISYIQIDRIKSDPSILPFETSIIIVKTDGDASEVTWSVDDSNYIFVGEPTYTGSIATHTLSAGAEAYDTATVTVSGRIFSDTWPIFNAAVPPAFVTTWVLGEDDLSIVLPLPSYGTYDFTVDWGDTTTSSVTAYDDVNRIHIYETSGTKIVSIIGIMTAWNFDEQEPFITTWSMPASSLDLTLPLPEDGTYSFVVNWGDDTYGIVSSFDDIDTTHTYATSGTKTVTITGIMTAWQFGSAEPFVTTWSLPASSLTIILPLPDTGTYDFTVDWGDGSPIDTVITWDDVNATHTYATSGTKIVTITGIMTAWGFIE